MKIELIKRFRLLKNSALLRKYMSHNRRVFVSGEKRQLHQKAVVLFELNNMQSSHIAYSYVSNALATEYNAKIIAYVPRLCVDWWSKSVFGIKKFFHLQEFGIYKSFGAVDFKEIILADSHKRKALKLYSIISESLLSKSDIEKITIDGVWLGDLIYDTYLRRYNKPTIDTASVEFQHFLHESIKIFVYWEDYFDSHDVRAVNVSHCVYNLAMPLRLAISRNIPAFQSTVASIYRMSKKEYFAYSDYRYFPDMFAAMPEGAKKEGIAEAQRRIEKRFAGEVGVDMAYSTKSAYGDKGYGRLITETHKKKILIAAHCFFDSPHSYGNNLFPDFYEWLEFLGKMTAATDYDWYLKTHPDYLPSTKEIVDDFVAKYPKFTLLPANASHHQIIAEGIDLALTVYGTIAFEYAALGIPVINCSLNNPHIAYNFNLHPKSIDEYRTLLLRLDALELGANKQQVYEYYFMRYIYNTENIFFDGFEATVKSLGGYKAQFTEAVYEKWLAEWTPEKHSAITNALQTYIRSGDFRMDYRHFGREFTTESNGARA